MTVIVERDGLVTTVTIDRPEARNAVDGPTAAALADAFRDFEGDSGAAVAVLTGAGGNFCAGADLKAVGTERGNRVAPEGDGPMGPTRMRLTKPVIAAIEGYAVAGGLELALWADLRVAARDAQLGVFCRRWGVPLIDGGTVRLPRLIGQSRALDLILTGRAVSAVEAEAIGLVNRVSEPGGALVLARELAAELAALPQTCLREDRLSVLEQWGHDEQAALAVELAARAGLTGRRRAGRRSSVRRGGRAPRRPGGWDLSVRRWDGRSALKACRTPRARRGVLSGGMKWSLSRSDRGSVAGAALSGNDVAQQLLDLRLAVAAVATESADSGQLAGLGPARDRLRVHAEHGGHLSGREEGFCFGRSRYHGAPLCCGLSELLALLEVCHRGRGSETGNVRILENGRNSVDVV